MMYQKWRSVTLGIRLGERHHLGSRMSYTMRPALEEETA
jgi:hypothetical protein